MGGWVDTRDLYLGGGGLRPRKGCRVGGGQEGSVGGGCAGAKPAGSGLPRCPLAAGTALLQIGAPFSDPVAAMTARRCFKNIHPILNGSALNIDAHFTFFDDHFSGEHETQKFHESLQ